MAFELGAGYTSRSMITISIADGKENQTDLQLLKKYRGGARGSSRGSLLSLGVAIEWQQKYKRTGVAFGAERL